MNFTMRDRAVKLELKLETRSAQAQFKLRLTNKPSIRRKKKGMNKSVKRDHHQVYLRFVTGDRKF